MASRPDLQLSTADRDQRPSDVRRPRFHEDFNAPFSEAILSAPVPSLHTTMNTCASSPSPEHSGDVALHGIDTPRQHASRPTQSREHSWSSTGTDSSRSSSSNRSPGVNDRIRDWARRSFLPTKRPDDGSPSRSS
ncbi:hypothetical protein E4U13_002959 [Claviceps humidiphila]|uniref:Uncharacterized protein n=2 Tax=Claviceps TaxID=5110 RepID=A0A9P7N0X7_9HYPO|nr:hypothetical protein E4U57_004445 [Claviceps arundinis]KAG5978366.1 hypothetical protein E4U56_002865 [Claviceps arundinis]KAG6115160.1 hypothetical protein E4U13_002959 [Claviceps humidiphila]